MSFDSRLTSVCFSLKTYRLSEIALNFYKISTKPKFNIFLILFYMFNKSIDNRFLNLFPGTLAYNYALLSSKLNRCKISRKSKYNDSNALTLTE